MGDLAGNPTPIAPMNTNDTQETFLCLSCNENYDRQGVSHWECAFEPQSHVLCVPCFADYIQHCCDHYAVSNKIPVRCSLPDCPALIPQHQIQALLNDEIVKDREVWELYLKTQLRVALEGGGHSQFDAPLLHRGVSHGKRDVAVTCMFCNQYAELYEPVAPDYWDKKQLQLQLDMEKKIDEVRPGISQEAEEKFHEQKVKLEQQLAKTKQQIIGAVGFEEDYKTLLENISRTAFRYEQLEEFLKEDKIAEQIGMSRPEIEEQIQNGSVQRVVDFIERYGFEFMSDEDWEELKHCYRWVVFCEKKGDRNRKKMAEISVKLSQIEQDREKHIHSRIKEVQNSFLEEIKNREVLSAINQVSEDNVNPLASAANMITTQFFVCRNGKCPGAFCLRCESFLEKKDMNKHVCKKDTLEVLYQEVLTILAENGSRKCPKCGYVGRKDLECTHIKCEKCTQSYCYVCGKSESELDDGLNQHNNWHVYTPDSENKCPLYLQYKYGDRPGPDDRLDGDPGVALEKFHEELQRKAIKEKRKKTDPALWQEMCYHKFPRGVFGDEVVEKPPERKDASAGKDQFEIKSPSAGEVSSLGLRTSTSLLDGDSKEEWDEKDEDKENIDNSHSVFHPYDSSVLSPNSPSVRNPVSAFTSSAKEKLQSLRSKSCKVQ